jgi:hypothetical protein
LGVFAACWAPAGTRRANPGGARGVPTASARVMPTHLARYTRAGGGWRIVPAHLARAVTAWGLPAGIGLTTRGLVVEPI